MFPIRSTARPFGQQENEEEELNIKNSDDEHHQDGHADDFSNGHFIFIFFESPDVLYVCLCVHPKKKKKEFFVLKKSRELPDCTSGINFIAFDRRNEMGGHERYEMMEEKKKMGTRSES